MKLQIVKDYIKLKSDYCKLLKYTYELEIKYKRLLRIARKESK